MSDSNKNKIKDYSLGIGIVSFIIVISLWIINWQVLNDYPNEVRGTHGDMFGAVNAVFSGLAFAGIILSLYMQRIDLKNQKEQLELNYEEVKQTNKEFKIQNDTLQIQKFENQYFKMIDLHKDNVNEIIIPFFDTLEASSQSQEYKKIETKTANTILRELIGRKGFIDMASELEFCFKICKETLINFTYAEKQIFEFAYRIFFWGLNSDFANSNAIDTQHQKYVKDALKLEQRNYKDNLTKNSKQKIKTRYVPFQGHESRLAHYYRHLFQTVKYVVKQESDGYIEYDDTRQYLRVLRAQLSNSEQLLLYYNYICGFGSNWDKLGNKGYNFFTRYRMIHNLPIDRVKFVEHPYEHFKDYRESSECLKDKMFEWED